LSCPGIYLFSWGLWRYRQKLGTDRWRWLSTWLKPMSASAGLTTRMHNITFTPTRDFLLETPWRIIIPNLNVNSH
jgi:hypothetical protein